MVAENWMKIENRGASAGASEAAAKEKHIKRLPDPLMARQRREASAGGNSERPFAYYALCMRIHGF